MISYWNNFINFCNSGHQWVFFAAIFIFWITCYFLLSIEMWFSDKVIHKADFTLKEYLIAMLVDQDQKPDFYNIIPYFIFAPAYFALSTIIFIFTIFYLIYKNFIKG